MSVHIPNFGKNGDIHVKRKDSHMWLDNLKELKKQKNMSSKQIAELTNLPERTVVRIFSGETPNPYADTLYRIVGVLGGSLDDILADSKAVVGSKNLATLQTEVDTLTAEVERLTAENAKLKEKADTLSAAYDILQMKLEHKNEIIAMHNHYFEVFSDLSELNRRIKPGHKKHKKITTSK